MTKTKRGRPTTYEGEKTCRAILSFADEMTKENFPERCSVYHVAVLLGCHVDTLYEWQKQHGEFSEAIKNWEAKRNSVAFEFRLWGDGRWIFCMKNWTGMTDRQEVAHSGKVETNDPLIIKVVHVKDGDKGNGNGNGSGNGGAKK